MSNFKQLANFSVEYAPSSIKKWISTRTGLQLCVVDHESPIVNGYFAVATECTNDSGAPHTLEHLIFMGSKKYPFKGLLDTLGNIAFSETNAWTATDQTVYTLKTAGWEGFKMLLPIYLDHILHPTLTNEACYTEVYHVDGDGKEKGVVFSEMQGIENQSWFVTMLEKQRTLHPSSSGYSSETGGLMENLRKLTNDQIREFHKESYRPSNLCVIVTGSVDETELLDVMDKLDNELPASQSVHRPFVDSEYQIPESRSETVVKTVEFAEKDTSVGEIAASWVGPSHNNYVDDLAFTVLFEYLTDSPISLLNRTMVEIDEPLANTVDYYTEDYTRTIGQLNLYGVVTESLDQVQKELIKIISEHNVDLERMTDVLESFRQQYVLSNEKSATDLSTSIITDFLYGDREAKQLKSLKSLADFDVLSQWDQSQWQKFYQQFLIVNKPVIILGSPSKELYAQQKQENKKLLEDRLAHYGEDGLKELKKKLDHAQETNDKPVPQEVLQSFGKPDPAKIKFINTQSIGLGLNKDVSNGSDELTNKLVEMAKDLPLYVHVENFKSEFLSLRILLSSFEMPEDLLPYYHLLTDIFSFPITENGEIIPFEDVVAQLNRDTIENDFDTSFAGQFEEIFTMKVQVKHAKYTKGVEWLHRIMFSTVFDESRIKILIEKFINSLPEKKRDGNTMLDSIYNRKVFTERSMRKSKDLLFVENIYKEMLATIEAGNFKEISSKMESVRTHLFNTKNMRVVINGDLSKVSDPVSPWRLFTGSETHGSVTSIPRTYEALSETGKTLQKVANIITTPASDSSYLNVYSKLDIDYLHPDVAKVALAGEYLQCVEGPFWRGIRGTGLAYGAGVFRDLEAKNMGFYIYRGTDATKSFTVARDIVNDYASGKLPFDATLMEAAVSSIVNSMASSEANFYSSASHKFMDNALKKRGPNFNTNFMDQLNKVTTEDLKCAMEKYYAPLFHSTNSAVFVSCHPTSLEQIETFFKAEGYTVAVEALEDDGDDHEGCDSCDDSDCESGCDSDCSSCDESEGSSEEE